MHVYQAISEVMGKLAKVGISKDNKNTQQGYKFRGIDDVYNAMAPYLAEAKLLILPRVLSRTVTERETRNGGALFYVCLDVEFDLVSAIDGSKHTIRVAGEAMDSGDKATNKAMSAAYKYACMEAFCIPTEGDNDADSQTHDVAARRTPLNPRDGLDKVDYSRVEPWLKKVADVMQLEPEVRALKIFEIHDELCSDEALYVAVGDALVDKGIASKALWKQMVIMGGKGKRAA